MTLVARSGDPASGAIGRTFKSFKPPLLNEQGGVAFGALLDASDLSTDSGVWTTGGGALALVAREDEEAPGAAGRRFRSFDRIALGDSGHLAIQASIDSLVSGLDRGLWVWNGTELFLVVKPGDAIDVDSGDPRIVDDVAFMGAALDFNRQRAGINGRSQLAFQASFIDGTSGVFLASYGDADIWLDKVGTIDRRKRVSFTLLAHNDPGCRIDQPAVCGTGGPLDAGNVTVTDFLPFTPGKVKVTAMSAGCTHDQVLHSVTCFVPVLANGTSVAFDIEIRLKGAKGDIVNQATVTSDRQDPDLGNNDVTLVLSR